MKIILKLIFYCTLTAFVANVYAQNHLGSDTSKGPDHLLWYSGKKKNDTTLITANGTKVTYSAKTNKVNVDIPAKEDLLKSLEDELNKTDQREQEARNSIESGSDAVLNAPIAEAVVNAYENVKEMYKEVTAKSIDLPETGLTPEQIGNANFLQNMLNNICPKYKSQYDDIMKFMEAHKKEKTFDLPPPPNMDYEHCWDCDPDKQKNYDLLVEHYDSALFVEERTRVKEALEILRTMQLIGFGEQGGITFTGDSFGQTLQQMLGSTKNSTTCSWMLNGAASNLWDAIYFLTHRVYYKAQSLFTKYKGDGHYLQAITKIYLGAERELELLGNPENKNVLQEVGDACMDFFTKYRERIFIKHDWTQLPNIKFLFSLARESALLGHDNDPLINNFVEDFMKYDRFKLTLDVDCKQGDGGLYQLAHLKGENYLRAVPDDSLCMRWILIESNDPNKYLKMDLIAADFIAPPEARPTYAGTHEWKTMPPDTHFHWCEDGKDTLIIHTIFPAGFKELWNIPHSGSINAGYIQSLLLSSFLDREHIEESGSEADAHQKDIEDKINKKGAEMEKMAAQMQTQMKTGKQPSASQMDAYSKMMKMGNDMQQTVTNYVPHAIGNYFFEVPVQNGNSIMIEAKIDGKKLFPDNTAIVYAWFNIKLEQAPKK